MIISYCEVESSGAKFHWKFIPIKLRSGSPVRRSRLKLHLTRLWRSKRYVHPFNKTVHKTHMDDALLPFICPAIGDGSFKTIALSLLVRVVDMECFHVIISIVCRLFLNDRTGTLRTMIWKPDIQQAGVSWGFAKISYWTSYYISVFFVGCWFSGNLPEANSQSVERINTEVDSNQRTVTISATTSSSVVEHDDWVISVHFEPRFPRGTRSRNSIINAPHNSNPPAAQKDGTYEPNLSARSPVDEHRGKIPSPAWTRTP